MRPHTRHIWGDNIKIYPKERGSGVRMWTGLILLGIEAGSSERGSEVLSVSIRGGGRICCPALRLLASQEGLSSLELVITSNSYLVLYF